MALHINLYHELQARERQRQRDPLKLAMLGLLVVAVGLLGYYLMRSAQVKSVRSRANALQAEYDALSPQEKTAMGAKSELDASIAKKDKLVQVIEGRFYWAPLLAKILSAVPREVQLIKLDGTLRQGGTKDVLMNIDGISAGEEPRKVADKLRVSLQKHLEGTDVKVTPTFKSLDDGTTTAHIDNQDWPTASFSIQLDMAAATPAPAPAAGKKLNIAKK